MQIAISEVNPACNAEEYLPACLQALGNSFVVPFETNVVDDGSKDATASIAADFGNQPLHTPPRIGTAAPQNSGARNAYIRPLAKRR